MSSIEVSIIVLELDNPFSVASFGFLGLFIPTGVVPSLRLLRGLKRDY